MSLQKDPPIRNREFLRRIKELISGCEWWPKCESLGTDSAHIRARGMGGGRRKDTPDNIIVLCREHHYHYDNVMGQSPENQEKMKGIIRSRPVGLKEAVQSLYDECRAEESPT